jgi:hypothetical protein
MVPLRASCCWFLLLAAPALGFQTFNFLWGDETIYLKWGANQAGTPGGTITWSLMPDGTTVDPSYTDPNVTGASNLFAIMDTLGRPAVLAAVKRVFARWEAIANINLVQVADSGLPFNNASATYPATGHIRIGAFPIANFGGGGVGFAPPPNGFTTLEGDVLFNSNSNFVFDPGPEGDPIEIFNDFESLLMHEVGHTLGLAHSDVCSVMSVDFACFVNLNREPDPDDIAGLQFLYGPRTSLAGDFNLSGIVDAGDYTWWRDRLGETGVTPLEYLLWKERFGSATAVAASVPEPAAARVVWFALLVGTVVMIPRKRPNGDRRTAASN